MATASKTHALVLTGLSIALIAAGAFVTVPFGPVPFTLQTLMIGVVICTLPPKYSVAAVGGYLALGCLGFPIFSGFRGGVAVLAGPTGGFLVGFLVAVIIIALIRSRVFAAYKRDTEADKARPVWLLPVLNGGSLVLLFLVYSVFGCAWFMVSTAATLEAALLTCVAPFVLADVAKSVAAFVCAQAVCAAFESSVATVR